MSASVLLAFASAVEGGPACLVEVDGRPVVRSLSDRLGRYGWVTVLTRPGWHGAVTDAVGDGTEVVACADTRATLAWLAAADTEVAVLHAHVVTADLAIDLVADGPCGRAAALTVPVAHGEAPTGPVRVARGRVVAAGSPYHELAGQPRRAAVALHLGGPALDRLPAIAREVTELFDLSATPDERAALDADLLAVLTVALVRSGVPLAAVPLPAAVPFVTVDGPSRASEIRAIVDDLDEEQIRLDGAVKADDGLFTTFLVSPYSRYWARWAARRGLRPDQVTVVSMVVGLGAAGAFAAGERWFAVIGAVLLQLAFTLDCVDGQLARYSRRSTPWGAWLDATFDRAKEYAVYAGLAIGGIRAGADDGLWLLAAAAMALQTVRHTIDFGYAAQQTEELAAAAIRPLTDRVEVGVSYWEPGVDAAVTSQPGGGGALPSKDDGEFGAGGPAAQPMHTPVSTGRSRAATSVAEQSSSAPASSQGSRPAPRSRRAGRPSAAGVVTTLREVETKPALKWAKRVVPLPIGERFALISIVAAVANARMVFLSLLVWGAIAALYTTGGRLVRSLA
jgi:phosphatidylglycerophosphate synthase